MTQDAAVPLMGKKLRSALGALPNESASIGVSTFARLQMAKMGWSVGKGLGKHEQGVRSHVKVKRRVELQGVGAEKKETHEQHKQWWYSVYDSVASKIVVDDELSSADETSGAQEEQKKKRKRARQLARQTAGDKRKDRAEQVQCAGRIPTADELFAATGGKLFGRRAYGSCNGKLKRDELQLQNAKVQESQDAATLGASSTDVVEEREVGRRRKKTKQSETEGMKKQKEKKKEKKREKKQAARGDSM